MALLSNTIFDFSILGGIVLILLIWNVILTIQFSKMSSKYRKFMRGSNGKNFEGMVIEQSDKVESAVERVNLINDDVVELKKQVDHCIQKFDIVRYNAFSDTGSDLSFSIALLDNYNNGMVLTGIYGRNETITYAKPVESGKSTYPLSVDEEKVLTRSIKGRTR